MSENDKLGGIFGTKGRTWASDKGVDSAHVGFDFLAVGVTECRERTLSRFIKTNRSDESVGGNGLVAENLRKTPLPCHAVHFHLPQTFLRMDKTESHQNIVDGAAAYVRDCILVTGNRYGT